MPRGTITKKQAFVILILTALISVTSASSACGRFRQTASPGEQDSAEGGRSFGSPEAVGRINSREIVESSGLAASKCAEGVLWTHNDSGDKNYIYAIDTYGTLLGKWRVQGAVNVDWEDIASFKDRSGRCFLYIGDIGGNSSSERRLEMSVYRVPEPADPRITSGNGSTETAKRIRIRYPEDAADAEALLVHPSNADIYIVSKAFVGSASVFRVLDDFSSDTLVTPLKIAELSLGTLSGGLITGGDISPDGRFVIVSDYFNGYEMSAPPGEPFDDVWKQSPRIIDLGERRQGESVCYSKRGDGIFATSEKRNSPLIRVSIK